MLGALVEAALHTLLLTALVKLGLWLFRFKRAQLLLIAWTVILAASLAMPALQWVIPLRLPVLRDFPSTTLIGAADPQLQPFVLEAPEGALATEIKEPAPMRPLLMAVYLLVSSILLVRLAVGTALSLRLLVKASPVPLDWAESAHIRISCYVAAPVTVANVILLPPDAVGWPPSVRRAVLAHEHAHVARWDFAMQLMSQVNRAIFWFSPLSWWLHRRLVALAELASDDHAMAVTGDRAGYAELLLEMGRRSGPVLRGLAMARPATLRYRIERILSERVSSHPVSPIQQMTLAIGVVGLSIVAASSDFNAGPPTELPALSEQQESPMPVDTIPSRSAQAAEDVPQPVPLPQPRTEMTFQAPSQSGPSVPFVPSDSPTALSRSHPIARVVARPQSNPAGRNALATQPSRAPRHLNPSSNGQVALEASRGARPVDSRATLPQPVIGLDPTNSSDADAEEHRPATPSHPVGNLPEGERPVLRLIDKRTCTGVYMPEHADTVAKDGLNVVPAILLRDASNTDFLTFFLGGKTPSVQPVTVKRERDRATKLLNTVFTMLPTSARYLNGFIKRPYARIDFDCGGSAAHLLDGGS